MEVVKIGGPVYRIGVGGGAASSVQVRSPAPPQSIRLLLIILKGFIGVGIFLERITFIQIRIV